MTETAQYMTGFGNHFETEAEENTLPLGRNSPQRVEHGLYAEQINGSAFTALRHQNLRSWLYRIHPAAVHGRFAPYAQPNWLTPPFDSITPPDQMRWSPMPAPADKTDFVDGLFTYVGHGSPETGIGAATHLYHCNQSMTDRFFYNADGDLLIVPQQGRLTIKTEMGVLNIEPKHIAVIPRGIKFQVHLLDDSASGYVCENFGEPFELPNLGPIGANGLANPRDFETPKAAYEHREGEFTIIAKFQGHFWQAPIGHSPLDVVAWHGNYVPYQYDLLRFNTINTVSFDHPDPSIFTVLTSQTNTPGVANVDFVIFPARWMVAEDTFRPPYFHRNLMSEFMGLIQGVYDAKPNGFSPGGATLHNSFTGHGPDANVFEKASNADLKPQAQRNTLAFMVESRAVWQTTAFALNAEWRQQDYQDCWQSLPTQFSPGK